jgi:hypothetical protein
MQRRENPLSRKKGRGEIPVHVVAARLFEHAEAMAEAQRRRLIDLHVAGALVLPDAPRVVALMSPDPPLTPED